MRRPFCGSPGNWLKKPHDPVQKYKLTTDVFCLPHLGGHIAYAPLKNVVMLVNAAAVDVLYKLDRGTFDHVNDTNIEVLSCLADLGLVNGEPDEVHEDGDGSFRPTATTLFLTTACNLRCVYCYASGGERSCTMPWEVAKSAVDFVVENAKAVEAESFGEHLYHELGVGLGASELLIDGEELVGVVSDDQGVAFRGGVLAGRRNGERRDEQARTTATRLR